MLKNITLSAIAVALPMSFGATASAAAPYAEQFVSTMGNINQTTVGAVVNGITNVQANRLERSCNDAALSARAKQFCWLLDDELDDRDQFELPEG
jgi:hypothetical protein